jgi:hypothetical protein
VLAWKQFGHERKLRARIVNYADDLVICCRPGKGPQAMATFRDLMTRLGLTVNERKTRLVQIPEERFDFLGYTIGQFYGRQGKPYIGTQPSKKAVRRLLRRIHEETSRQWNWQTAEKRVSELNPILRGWCQYFNQGPVKQAYELARRYTERRFRRWMMRRSKRKGTGYKQYSDSYLYDTLGLFKPPDQRRATLNAKA